MYEKVSSNLNFVEREKKTEKFWEDHDIFRKSIDLRAGGKTYTFYDGVFFSSRPIRSLSGFPGGGRVPYQTSFVAQIRPAFKFFSLCLQNPRDALISK